MRHFSLVLLALLTASGVGISVTSASAGSGTEHAGTATTSSRRARARAIHYLAGEVERYQQTTWRWQHLMGRPLTHTYGRTLSKLSVADVKQAVALWRAHARTARRHAHHPPYLRAWLCIHRHEASWHDHGAPYYGGLQMDITFQRRYAPRLLKEKGTADHWTPLEQIWVAEKARRSGRGFYPWPNTARDCGLI